MADLVRNLDMEFEIDFIKIESYGDETSSSGTVRLIKDISADITNRHIIVIEDIVDTGLSLTFLQKTLLLYRLIHQKEKLEGRYLEIESE